MIVFLDRDGVINRFPGIGRYVTSMRQFRLIKRSLKAIARLTAAGFELNVVSNQGCVSRGLITRRGLKRLTDHMLRQVSRHGGRIERVLYCTHQTSDRCACKKPSPLLVKKALGRRRARRTTTYFVGDSLEDIRAGRAARCTTVLVLSGRLSRKDVKGLPSKPHAVKRDLWDATAWILDRTKS